MTGPSPSLNLGQPITCPFLSQFSFSLPWVLSCPSVSISTTSFPGTQQMLPILFHFVGLRCNIPMAVCYAFLKMLCGWVVELTAESRENIERPIIMTMIMMMMIAMVLLSTCSLPGNVESISHVFIHLLLH